MWNRVVVAIVLAGCSNKPAKAKLDPGSAAAPSPIATTADAATASPKPARAKATPQQLVEFRTHMKAGWAAQKAKRWADAVTAFEAALKIFDGDVRALTELGWSAMNAGDLAKARKADDAAVHAAVDPKVKAAGLYNLGLVQAQLGDKAGALASFQASLQLRPNKTVEAEVTKLGASPTAEAVFCAPGKTACDCIEDDELDPSACAESSETKSPVAGFHVYRVTISHGFDEYLLDEHDQLVAILDGEDEHREAITEIKLDKAEVRTVAGHRVLWVQTTSTQTLQTLDFTEPKETVHDETIEQKTVAVCAIGDAKTPTRCFHRAPLSKKTTSDDSVIATDGSVRPSEHAETETTLDIALADDGTVTVKLVKGSADDLDPTLLGSHKLW